MIAPASRYGQARMSRSGTSLEEYGAAVATALLRPVDGGPATDPAGRRALLDASARVDRAALARFGASFLKAYPPRPPPAPPVSEAPSPEPAPPAKSASPSPRLTVKEYAVLRAECMTAPHAALGDVYARYGLDAAGEKAEVHAWSRAFAASPSLFEQYKVLFQEARKTVAAERGDDPVLPMDSSRGHRLSIHQYASLRADCISAPPDTLEEVRARYGLDVATEAAEVKAWGQAFTADPALFQQYLRLFRYFRGMLAPSAPT